MIPGRGPIAALLGLIVAVAGERAHADNADAGTPVVDAESAKAEANANAAAAASLEAQLIELRGSLAALQGQRAAFDDIRVRLDQMDARLAEDEHRAEGGVSSGGASDAGVVRFRDEGFIIRSPDDRFLLRPRVRIQAVYAGGIATAGLADRLNGIPANPDVSSFFLAHAEVILEGHAVSPVFEYRLQLDAVQPHPINDAFVRWRPARSLALETGQLKIPYGLQNQVWTADLSFVDVSAPTAAFALGWDLGLMLVGRPLAGRLAYELAIVNGAGAGLPNDNLDLAYAAHIVAAPFGPLPASEGDLEGHARPLVSGGVSGFYNLLPTDVLLRDPTASVDVDHNGRVDNVAIWQGAAELRAIWRGASVQAEWFSRLEDPGAGGASRRYWGAYAQGSYFVVPHRLLLGARIGQTDLPLYGVTAAERALRGARTDEQSAVVSAYLGGNRAKLQVDYSHLTATDATSTPTEHRVRAAVQLGF